MSRSAGHDRGVRPLQAYEAVYGCADWRESRYWPEDKRLAAAASGPLDSQDFVRQVQVLRGVRPASPAQDELTGRDGSLSGDSCVQWNSGPVRNSEGAESPNSQRKSRSRHEVELQMKLSFNTWLAGTDHDTVISDLSQRVHRVLKAARALQQLWKDSPAVSSSSRTAGSASAAPGR
jgi:hypothetical protein